MAERARASGDTIRGVSATEELYDDFNELVDDLDCASLLQNAQTARRLASSALTAERFHVIRFCTAAKEIGWSWARVGDALGVSGTAARRYYGRNKEDG